MNEKLLLNEIPARIATQSVAGGPLPDQSDDEIIERVRKGDANAFEILERRYNRWVSGIVSKHAARDQAADIAQEVFIQAYKSLPHYRMNTSFRQWLATIAVRRCYYYCRAANRHPTCVISNLNAEATEQMEQSLQATACEAANSEMDLDKMRETLGRAMDGFEADVQTILWMIYWEGYSQEETAEILGYSPGSVKAHASRARVLLRQRMNQEAISDPSPAPGNVYQAEGLAAVS